MAHESDIYRGKQKEEYKKKKINKGQKAEEG